MSSPEPTPQHMPGEKWQLPSGKKVLVIATDFDSWEAPIALYGGETSYREYPPLDNGAPCTLIP